VIDTHCHLLPALDDGPSTESRSLALALALVEAGVACVVCTPHYSRRFPTEQALAAARLERLRTLLGAAEIGLELVLAAEISPAFLVSAPSPELIERRAGRFVIVELEPSTPVPFLEVAVDLLRAEGLRAVFAHPERCRPVSRAPEALEAVRSAGALVQVVAPSLTGRSGVSVGEAAWELLDAGLADLLASDAHRISTSGLHLARALRMVGDRYGPEAVRLMTVETPALLVGNERQQ